MPVAVAPEVSATTMEITVSKFDLLRELTATQGVVERKTTIPILSNYLFEAAGDKLSLTATDLDLSANTVAVHRANIMDALGMHKTAELVVYAIRSGLVNIR